MNNQELIKRTIELVSKELLKESLSNESEEDINAAISVSLEDVIMKTLKKNVPSLLIGDHRSIFFSEENVLEIIEKIKISLEKMKEEAKECESFNSGAQIFTSDILRKEVFYRFFPFLGCEDFKKWANHYEIKYDLSPRTITPIMSSYPVSQIPNFPHPIEVPKLNQSPGVVTMELEYICGYLDYKIVGGIIEYLKDFLSMRSSFYTFISEENTLNIDFSPSELVEIVISLLSLIYAIASRFDKFVELGIFTYFEGNYIDKKGSAYKRYGNWNNEISEKLNQVITIDGKQTTNGELIIKQLEAFSFSYYGGTYLDNNFYSQKHFYAKIREMIIKISEKINQLEKLTDKEIEILHGMINDLKKYMDSIQKEIHGNQNSYNTEMRDQIHSALRKMEKQIESVKWTAATSGFGR